MRRFIASNIAWLYRYFEKNRSLLEVFSFLMVAQSFIYSVDLRDVEPQSISAFKIVLWVMIFIVILLLQVSTSVELEKNGEHISGTLFKGANFMKIVMRLLTLVLLVASVPIFIRQLEISVHNKLFSVFYGSLAVVLAFEVLAFTVAKFIPKALHITYSTLHIPSDKE